MFLGRRGREVGRKHQLRQVLYLDAAQDLSRLKATADQELVGHTPQGVALVGGPLDPKTITTHWSLLFDSKMDLHVFDQFVVMSEVQVVTNSTSKQKPIITRSRRPAQGVQVRCEEAHHGAGKEPAGPPLQPQPQGDRPLDLFAQGQGLGTSHLVHGQHLAVESYTSWDLTVLEFKDQPKGQPKSKTFPLQLYWSLPKSHVHGPKRPIFWADSEHQVLRSWPDLRAEPFAQGCSSGPRRRVKHLRSFSMFFASWNLDNTGHQK